jgi:predicted nuclease of predicted toxin-antitoxin system
MNFLVDAQLPRRLSRRLEASGHDSIHTLDLPAGNRTTDIEINAISIRENRVVITKDADFVNSLLLIGQPFKLLLISTGNISNAALDALFESSLPSIVIAMQTCHFLELTRTTLIIHG